MLVPTKVVRGGFPIDAWNFSKFPSAYAGIMSGAGEVKNLKAKHTARSFTPSRRQSRFGASFEKQPRGEGRKNQSTHPPTPPHPFRSKPETAEFKLGWRGGVGVGGGGVTERIPLESSAKFGPRG